MNRDDTTLHALLDRLGLHPTDLHRLARTARGVPTFGEYLPHLETVVPAEALRTYRPYWTRLTDLWHDRPIDAPTSRDLDTLVDNVRRHAVTRRNTRNGRAAADHMIDALRCLYRTALDEGHLTPDTNPAADLHRTPRRPAPHPHHRPTRRHQPHRRHHRRRPRARHDRPAPAPRNRLPPHNRPRPTHHRHRSTPQPHPTDPHTPGPLLATHLPHPHRRTPRPPAANLRPRTSRPAPALPPRPTHHPPPLRPPLGPTRPPPPLDHHPAHHHPPPPLHHPRLDRSKLRPHPRPLLHHHPRTHPPHTDNQPPAHPHDRRNRHRRIRTHQRTPPPRHTQPRARSIPRVNQRLRPPTTHGQPNRPATTEKHCDVWPKVLDSSATTVRYRNRPARRADEDNSRRVATKEHRSSTSVTVVTTQNPARPPSLASQQRVRTHQKCHTVSRSGEASCSSCLSISSLKPW